MKLSKNMFTQALQDGSKQLGLWVSLRNNFAAEVVAHSGFDWFLIDMEHSPNDLSTVLSQLQVFEATGGTAIVRPDWNDPVLVKRLLDLGAPGLLFPMIQSVEEAQQAVAATRYPPRGIRGVSSNTRANKFSRVTDYFDRVEDETTIILQLETRQAIEQAEAIGSVDGVSGVFFGPADIAADIGHLGKPLCDEVWELIMPAARALMDKGVPVGTLVLDNDFAARLLKEGFSFVACGADLSLLGKGADNLVATMKSKLT
ncbi:MAG: HpcH/HpaI aldolase/citrate lyase family protein [Granulosicoccus sp.]